MVDSGEGDDHPDFSFGDGMTPNLTGVLEPDGQEEDFEDDSSPERSAPFGHPSPHRSGHAVSRPSQTGTASSPAAYGMTPLAPIGQRE